MSDNYGRLWHSTEEFLKRFDVTPEAIPPTRRQRHFIEEVLEFLQASVILEYATELHQEGYLPLGEIIRLRGAVGEEHADVLVTLQNILMGHNFTEAEAKAYVEAVAMKNDFKTTETHHKVNGKITRRLTPPE